MKPVDGRLPFWHPRLQKWQSIKKIVLLPLFFSIEIFFFFFAQTKFYFSQKQHHIKMPKSFDRCVKGGGKVVTKSLSGHKYMHMCKDKGGKWHAGHTKTKKDAPQKSHHKRK